MKVAVLGTGDVGKTLGKAFIALGHEVKMGAREATNEKAAAWCKEMGDKASHGTFADAAAFAELVVLATLGAANQAVLEAVGPDNLAGKILIDTTNDTIVGAHMLGPEYGELINVFSLAIKLGLTTRQLKSMTAAYPTVGSDIGSML